MMIDFATLMEALRRIAETGGPVVIVLMAVAVLTLAVAIYKCWQFWMAAVGRHAALSQAVAKWDSGDKAGARQIAERGFLLLSGAGDRHGDDSPIIGRRTASGRGRDAFCKA
mgnify:CR=1 FL=1